MKFEIDRSKWRSGGGTRPQRGRSSGRGATCLLNDEGYMCCLGFLGLACGVPKNSLHGVCEPTQLPLSEFVKYPISLFSEFMDVNDESSYSREKREERLSYLFGNKGIQVSFVGEYEN